MRISDRILLALLKRRLARCKTRGDIADKFSDAVVALLSAEMARRARLLDGWDAEAKAAEAAAAERARRAAAETEFQSFEPTRERLRLQ